MKKEKNFSRRDFIKAAGAAGAGSMLAVIGCKDKTANENMPNENTKNSYSKMPVRPLGKTGVKVPILSLGGSDEIMSKHLLLKQAIKMGVTYWDTAHTYGNSEAAMGKYLGKYPEDRKKIFLVTKCHTEKPEKISEYLENSLKTLRTDFIDLFLIHSVSDVSKDLNNEIKAWSEKARSSGKIKLFGFSSHKNMERCLIDGSKLGWIDAVMASYNFRLMFGDMMKKGVEDCVKAGIGLIAMKTQAPLVYNIMMDVGCGSDKGSELTDHFMKKGFTLEQAKLKAVWENPHIASVCSIMPNMAILKANVEAALDKTKLTKHEIDLFKQYTGDTSSGYCHGCSHICESIYKKVPISDIMRFLMYYHGYGDRDRAKLLFSKLPGSARSGLTSVDFSRAEAECPYKIPIAQYMKEASNILA